MFDVANGAGLASVWGSWACYAYQEEPEKFAQFAVNVLDIPAGEKSAEDLAMEGICAMEDYFRSIHMPTSLTELGISPTDALLRVVNEFKVSEDKIGQIDQAMDVLTHEITKIDQNVDQISNVIHTNSATAEASAAASEELLGQANELKRLVVHFKFRSEDIG